jgi:hypothetical protein
MSDKREFMRQERAALDDFMRRHPDDDSRAPAVYGREYRCECGFETRDPNQIFDHASADVCTKGAEH